MAKKKSKAGRKTKKNEEILRKIDEAAEMDCTIEEIAFHAGIHPATLYRWCEKKKKLRERIDALRQNPIILARKTVIKGIQENPIVAMDYLKRKRKEEFGDNLDLTTKGQSINPYTDEQREQIANRIIERRKPAD